MKVSIIIPVYNAEKFLEETLLSAINQTYQDTEIIAVYDGYPDNSMQILQKYSNKIKIITKESGSASSALNVGIKISSGDWIKRLDADDVLYPIAIEELIKSSKNLKDNKNTILYSNYDIIDSNGKMIEHHLEQDYKDLLPFDFNVMLLDHMIGLPSTSLIHKSTIRDYGMFDEKINFEDYELWVRYCLLHNCRLHLVSKTLAKHRIHPGQITKFRAKHSLQQTNQIRTSVLEKLEPLQRRKYEKALKQYRKNKTFMEKSRYFVRYKLFQIIPSSISSKMVDAYWSKKRRKISYWGKRFLKCIMRY